ncbi:MAG: aminoacetone oxidase family FAD-binding enzyme [[Eubacterium] siraeum]|nr:aminoacetone oxidase family FAD-binding enzyme [[Eubacterium] siraeum]
MKKRCDLLIVGGGAAGLACAAAAGERLEGSAVLLEHKPRVGKKLLVTGNGRCNLSNINMSEDFYRGSFNVSPILEEYPDVRPFFEKIGLYTLCDSAGRIYPLSGTAASVADALRFAAEKSGRIRVLTDVSCTDIKKAANGFHVRAGEYEINARAVVLACGGCAAPVQGSDGSGFALAKGLGISVSEPYPALCALLADDTKALEGVRSKCAASLFLDGQLEKRELGEVQFTKNGLSGICIFNLSAAFGTNEKNAVISLDLLPDYTSGSVYQMLLSAAKARSRNLNEDIFSGIFNKKLALYLLKKANIPTAAPSEKTSYDGLKRLAYVSKNLEFSVRGRADFAAAQVTAGGVCGSEIDGELMAKKAEGLFFAGEIIDAWGECGGYNLHFAFASGIKAASSAVKFLY